MIKELQEEVRRELLRIGVPPQEWSERRIAIIGAGMAGLSAAFQLLKVGLTNVVLFDENEKGYEGPWVTYARMRTLRSGKELTGPAFDFPSLTFESWFTAHHGAEAWKSMGKIPNSLWMNYLSWFGETLKLKIQNKIKITELMPYKHGFLIEGEVFDKVILANGRGGFGGPDIPNWVSNLPKERWAHTTEPINFQKLKGKKVLVIGSGASAFDASAVAIENGASSVDMHCRRGNPGCVNKLGNQVSPGVYEGFYYLPDKNRCEFLLEAWDGGAVPPHEAIERIMQYSNFRITKDVNVYDYEFIILGTGFTIDGYSEPLVKNFMPDILLWGDRLNPKEKAAYPFAAPYPYLGDHFQFITKTNNSYLKHIYCFNWGAGLSHGIISGDIPGIGWGARRLALGITADIFVENYKKYYKELKEFVSLEFNPACLKR